MILLFLFSLSFWISALFHNRVLSIRSDPFQELLLSNARNHGYQVKKTPEEIEREIKAQEAELQKLLQESVGFVVFFRIFSFFEFAQHRLIRKRMPLLYNSHHFETQVHLKLPSTALWFEPPTIVRWAFSELWESWLLLLRQPPLLKSTRSQEVTS